MPVQLLSSEGASGVSWSMKDCFVAVEGCFLMIMHSRLRHGEIVGICGCIAVRWMAICAVSGHLYPVGKALRYCVIYHFGFFIGIPDGAGKGKQAPLKGAAPFHVCKQDPQ